MRAYSDPQGDPGRDGLAWSLSPMVEPVRGGSARQDNLPNRYCQHKPDNRLSVRNPENRNNRNNRHNLICPTRKPSEETKSPAFHKAPRVARRADGLSAAAAEAGYPRGDEGGAVNATSN